MSIADELLLKAAKGGKYYKRIQSGTKPNGKPKYRYFYSKEQYEKHMEKQGKSPHIDGERAAKETKSQKAMKHAKSALKAGGDMKTIRSEVMEKFGFDKRQAGQIVIDARNAVSRESIDEDAKKREKAAKDYEEGVRVRAERAALDEKTGMSEAERAQKRIEVKRLIRTLKRAGADPKTIGPRVQKKFKLTNAELRSALQAAGLNKSEKSEDKMNDLMKSQARAIGLDTDDPYEEELFKSLMKAPMIGPPETLAKGLYAFSGYDKPQRLPDNYLPAYLNAFIEEAYEHECRESKHRGPRLQDGDPEDYIARMIFNELMIYAVKNQNLLRACKKVKCSVEYIKAQLKAQGLAAPTTSQDQAERDAQVAGYHPRTIGEGEPATAGYGTTELERSFTASEQDLRKAVEEGARLKDGPETVHFADDRGDAAARLRKAETSKVNQQWGFGPQGFRQTEDDGKVDLFPPSRELSGRGKSRTH